MKKRFIFVAFVLILFLSTLIPATVVAKDSEESKGIGGIRLRIVGKGTATDGEVSTKVTAVFVLRLTAISQDSIEFAGVGRLAIKGTDIVVSFIGGDDSDFGGVISSYSPETKTLKIVSGDPSIPESNWLYLSGTIDNAKQKNTYRAELSGTLSIQSMSIELEILSRCIVLGRMQQSPLF